MSKGHWLVGKNGNIALWSPRACSAKEATCVCLDDVEIAGDELPEFGGDAVGGTYIGGVYTAPPAPQEDPIVAAFKALDPSTLSGDLKTIVEYLQR